MNTESKNPGFMEFNPLGLDLSQNKESIRKYYEENSLPIENTYLKKYLENDYDVSKPSSSFTTPPAQVSFNRSEFDPYTKVENEARVTLPVSNNDTFVPTSLYGKSSTPQKTLKTKAEFMDAFGGLAKKAAQESGLSEDMILAQLALETGWGKKIVGNNVGGIKAWKPGKSVTANTSEFRDGKMGREDATFQAYESLEEGFNGYIEFLKKNKRYKGLFGISDPFLAADAMGKTGYATDPKYTTKLKNIIKEIQKQKNT